MSRRKNPTTEQERRQEALLAVHAALGGGQKPLALDASLQLAIIGAWDAPDRIEYYQFQLDALDDLTGAVT